MATPAERSYLHQDTAELPTPAGGAQTRRVDPTERSGLRRPAGSGRCSYLIAHTPHAAWHAVRVARRALSTLQIRHLVRDDVHCCCWLGRHQMSLALWRCVVGVARVVRSVRARGDRTACVRAVCARCVRS